MNNKTLLYIFLGLLVIFGLSRIFSGTRDSSFDPDIVQVDSSAVTKIVLTPKAESGETVTLNRGSAGWTATKGDRSIKVPYSKVQGILGQLHSQITAKRIVSRAEEKWPEYEVNETGSRVEVYTGNEPAADFIVGTFKFDQARRSASSYVRLSGEEEVYLVDGFLSMQYNQGFNAFRDNAVVKLNSQDIRGVSLRQADGEQRAMQKLEDDQWYLAGMELLDSAKVAQYVTGLASVQGYDFAGDFDAQRAELLKTVNVTGNNMIAPVEIRCYANTDTTHAFVLHSTMNADAYFLSDSTGIYHRVFGNLEDILYGE